MATPRRIRKPMPLKGLRSAWPADVIGQEFTPNCLNVRFRFGEAINTPGRGLFDGVLGESVQQIPQFFTTDGLIWPMLLTVTKLYRRGNLLPNDIASWQRITGTFTPVGSRRWSTASGENKFFFCRGDDEIARWDGVPANQFSKISADAGYQATGSGQNVKARYLEYYANRLIAGYTVEGANTFANRIRFPQNGDYTKWNESLGLGAGFLDIADEWSEEIAGIKNLQDRCIIYRPHSIGELMQTGSIDPVFQYYTRTHNLGLLAPYTLDGISQVHFFLANDKNVWMWDGAQGRSISDQIQEDLQSLVNTNATDSYFGFVAHTRQEYWLLISDPARGTYDAFIYDYKRDYWSRDSFPNITCGNELTISNPTQTWNASSGSWDSDIGTWDELSGLITPTIVAGRTDGATMRVDETLTGDYFALGSIIDRFLETEDFYIDDDPTKQFTSQRVLLVYEYASSDPFEFGFSQDRGRTWTTQQITPSMKGYSWIDFRCTGNIIRYRFRENNANGRFRWRSYVHEFFEEGPWIGTT